MKKKESKSETERRKEKGKEIMGENKKSVKRKEQNKGGEKSLLGQEGTLFIVPTNMLLHIFPSITIMHASKNKMLDELQDVFPKDVPYELPLLRYIEHHMDLTLGATLPNEAAYKIDPGEAK
ncbi:hypothetical protein CR513_12511, partial [Mucuna pruriens]